MEDQHAATQALDSNVQELRADIDFNFDHMLQLFASLNGPLDPATEASSSAAETVPLNISTVLSPTAFALQQTMELSAFNDMASQGR